MQKVLELYKNWSGSEAGGIRKLAGAGSNRTYFRLTGGDVETVNSDGKTVNGDGKTVIGVVGTSREENDAFVYLARHFEKMGLPMPRVLAVSDDGMRYLQTDLGETALFDALAKGRNSTEATATGGRTAGKNSAGGYSEEEKMLLKRTIRLLPEIQNRGAEGLDFSHCYPQPAFDRTNVMFDLNYFKYSFLKLTDVDFNEFRLETDFCALAEALTKDDCNTFMYRDFQARNVMLDAENNPWFIDFQGGRRGPFYYDLASFLWQASAKYPQTLREELIDEYYNRLQEIACETSSTPTTDATKVLTVPPRDEFDRRLKLFVFFRTLQVLGAYGFRGLIEGKQHFINSIPLALENLQDLLAENVCPFAYLNGVLRQLKCESFSTEAPLLSNGTSVALQRNVRCQPTERPLQHTESLLVVKVFSFSFHKGIPKDDSGNGGGYVFDCRATHNPGRYAPYKKLTGLDESVIRFLEDDGEIVHFLENIYQLADTHVERYIERGFTSLMFSFGCTGGQHRSVYSAQHLAEHISRKYGVEVRLCHREQNITQTFEQRLCKL